MKSTETKLTAYGRWRCRTSVYNYVILTSVVVVGAPERSARARLGGRLGCQSSSFCDDDRHNAICRGYRAGTMAARAIIGDELYRSPVNAGRVRSHCGSRAPSEPLHYQQPQQQQQQQQQQQEPTPFFTIIAASTIVVSY